MFARVAQHHGIRKIVDVLAGAGEVHEFLRLGEGWVVADPFLPLTALDASDYADALEAMTAMDSELYAAPELWAWRGFEPLEFGCRFGGRVRIAAQIASYGITLDECEFARGLPIDATGTIDLESGELDVTVRVPRGELTYRYEGGAPVVDGIWKGEKVHQRG